MTSAETVAGGQRSVIDHAPVPFGRILRVELRKLVDTRSGLWLLIAIGAVTAIAVTITLFAAKPADLTYDTLLVATGVPQGILLPVLGIMAVTTEWTQRTSLVTFTLVPHRPRVVWAKLCAVVLLGLVAVVFAFAVAALGTVLGQLLRDGVADWSTLGGTRIADTVLGQTLGVLQGVGYGMLFMNTAVSIVVYFAAPTAMSILVNSVSALAGAAPWIDFGTAQQPLFSADALTAEQWAQLAVASAIWIILPLLGGIWRLLRREVK